MTVQNFVVEYSTNRVTWTFLANVQNVSIKTGRTNLQDTFEPSTASVTLRYPNGYASPITALVVGSFIRIKRSGMSAIYNYLWEGTIRDVVANYGFPYLSSVGEADFLTISAEGSLAEAGRAQGNDYSVTSDYADTQLSAVEGSSGVQMEWEYSYGSIPQLATSTVSGSYSEWLNTFAASLGAAILDGSSTITVRPKDYNANLTVSFSDTANNSTNQVYDVIRFDSLAADYFTQVEVNTNTVGNVVVNTGSAPYRTLRLSTFSVDTGQAQDLGNYYLGIYSQPTFGISEISCLAEAQNSMNLELGSFWFGLIGAKTSVTFRGTTFYVTILGCSIDARPDSARYTFYVTAADLTPYFVLDSAEFGVLDQNKLSW